MLRWKICSLVASAAMLVALTATAEDVLVKTGSGTLTLRSSPAGSMTVVVGEGESAPVEARGVMFERGEYWLGVLVSPPSPALQAQLKLSQGQGLLVEAVEPKSPAAKAGIQQYDVLLKGNGKPLGDLRDLVKLIGQVKEGKLTLDLLRGGKQETVVATLAKRPAGEMGSGMSPNARAWIQRIGPNMNEGEPMQFHIVGPGQILPPGAAGGPVTAEAKMFIKTKLSDGSQLEITRVGVAPAKVVVTNGKDRWEGTSEDLDKIPEKIRPEVKKHLESMSDHVRIFAAPGGPGSGNVLYFGGAAPPPGIPGTITAVGPGVEKRLAELQKQVDDLKQRVDALQGNAKPKK